MTTKHAKDLQPGDFFKLKADARAVYVFGTLRGWRYVRDYDRRTRRYYATRFDDICRGAELEPTRTVFTDFVF